MLCGCTVDAELGAGSVCTACGHRDHGKSGCRAPAVTETDLLTLTEVNNAAASGDFQVGMRAIHDILWDPIDPDRQWEVETIEYVAEVVQQFLPDALREKKRLARRTRRTGDYGA